MIRSRIGSELKKSQLIGQQKRNGWNGYRIVWSLEPDVNKGLSNRSENV